MSRCALCGIPLLEGETVIDVDFKDAPYKKVADIVEKRPGVGSLTLANEIRENGAFIGHETCLKEDTSWFTLRDEWNQIVEDGAVG